MYDPTCLFCAEAKSIQHLYFYCVVAKYLWGWISDIWIAYFYILLISFVAPGDKNPKEYNMVCAASMWSI